MREFLVIMSRDEFFIEIGCKRYRLVSMLYPIEYHFTVVLDGMVGGHEICNVSNVKDLLNYYGAEFFFCFVFCFFFL